MGKYSISCEIAGPCACWTRPDTGDCPVSYPAPTYSAVKGVFSSVLWGPAVEIVPVAVEICSPLRYESYLTNYGGPLRKSDLVSSGDNYQLLATILVDVCYKLYAKVRPIREGREKLPESAKSWDSRTTSPGHAYKAIFERRLKRGQCFHIPFLGWKEFVPDYFGVCRDETKPCKDISQTIPSMLFDVFSDGYKTEPKFSFIQNAEIKEGLLLFPESAGEISA